MWLLTPDIPPFNRKYKDRVQPFYGINERIPLLLTVLLGIQHAMSMMGGGKLLLMFSRTAILGFLLYKD